ncbi:MAG: UDP-N-acetylmuramoyl-L-alanyl-D-glutamate--2,6-diaminopimelate ligase [Elusimicrobiota bacterium]
MKLSELMSNFNIDIIGNTDKEIAGITCDSRKVLFKNYLFAALSGTKEDGKKYIKDAIDKGAIAILTDDRTLANSNATYLCCSTETISEMFGKISARFYNEPSQKMKVFAVTGTNGKTTITYLLEKIFQHADIKLGVIGTISYEFGDFDIPAVTTTPQSCDLHELLARMKTLSADGVAIEVSSHGLAQNRIAGLNCDVAIFTNLTRDHLDYHKTMDAYKKAKFLLFEKFLAESQKSPKFAVLNLDDPAGKELSNKQIAGTNIVTYGIKSEADIRATDITLLKNQTEFNICIKNERREKKEKIREKIKTKLIGRHNVYNILAAVSCAYWQNIPLEKIVKGIEQFETVPGRFETVDAGQPFTVIVDYAHTPDALGNLIQTARTIKHRKIITVFGCGGDRDRSKRPLMGELSGRLSDYTIITSDNPRTEKPERIILDIEIGLQRIKCKNYEVIIERTEAIKKAISLCGPDDIILIAGKGHENYQIIGEIKIPYSDKETVSQIVSEIWKKSK